MDLRNTLWLGLIIKFVMVMVVVSAFGYKVVFADHATTFGGPVMMNELVLESDIPTELLKSIIVAYVPSGSTTTVDKRFLLTLLKRKIKEIQAEFGESNVVKIEAKKELAERGQQQNIVINEEELIKLIHEELYNHYPRETKFELKSKTGTIPKHTDFSLSLTMSSKATPSVRVTFRNSGRVVGYVLYQFSAFLERKVAVANRRINKDEVISVSDVKFVEVNIFSLTKAPVLEEDLPLFARKNFLKDEILDLKYLDEVPTILKGQLTKAFSVVGGVTVSTLVQALESGYTGNVINVKIIDGGVILKGIVRDDGTVAVLEVK
uniref:Flagellar basal body P-ring formation protein FlgA n=1 Tax=Fervidobacterium thailandense TaxID=1008305 RepID=A0A7C5RIL6_9BACT